MTKDTMTSHDLRISLVQTETVWRDPAQNRSILTDQLAPLAGQTDLVLLPETFTSGFDAAMPHTLEDMRGPTVRWLCQQARRLQAVVAGSLPIGTDEGVFNRFVWATPDGRLETYDKRHLFRYAGEHLRYTAGHARLIIQWRGWRILPLICYDLRFPLFCRNRFRKNDAAHSDFDLQVVVANWPSLRACAWTTLLRARAIENQCYVAGVNRVGRDGNGLHYGGGSAVITMHGEAQIEVGSSVQVVTTVVDRRALLCAREQFPVLSDADPFTLADQRTLL